MIGTVRVSDLSKTYQVRQRKGLFKSQNSSVEALKGVTMEVNAGEIFGLLGPNGAGKTTLIKILTTLLLPTTGEAWVNGYQLTRQDNQLTFTWNLPGFVLEQNSDLANAAGWTPVPGGDTSGLTIIISPTGSRFFRLQDQ